MIEKLRRVQKHDIILGVVVELGSALTVVKRQSKNGIGGFRQNPPNNTAIN